MNPDNVLTRGAELEDANDYTTVQLADGSIVEVYGDGTVYHILSEDADNVTRVNLYMIGE